MRRYLVVSNQTLSSEALVDKVRTCRAAAGHCQFHLVVPATHGHEHLTWTEGHDKAIARERLNATLARLREIGAAVDGEVGDARPLDAIADAMRGRPPFDEILLFTHPPGLSRWLHQDLPHRVQRQFATPVTHVVAEPATA
ncbi:MAG TPA: hypothetical protein VHM89_06125 [Acidimicrobiales bacterium]|nr:hypothetical protein [Acidimicrobiales bacterium]